MGEKKPDEAKNTAAPKTDAAKDTAAKKKPAAKKKTSGRSRLRALELTYQPVFDVHLNIAIDYETTFRINDRQMGGLLHDAIIPVAMKSPQICDLNIWNIEEVCDAIIRCDKREADINRVIIPMSVRYLSRKTMFRQIVKIVETKGVNPDKFCFNISENILESEKLQVKENIKSLREYGFLVSIDDFGVEYTALSHLGQYEVDYIGLNSSLVEDIMTNERTQNMVQGIMDFVKKLDSQVKVDGVDSKEKAELLRSMGADQMKGGFYGKPISERQIRT